jgi:hypothetical protein
MFTVSWPCLVPTFPFHNGLHPRKMFANVLVLSALGAMSELTSPAPLPSQPPEMSVGPSAIEPGEQ